MFETGELNHRSLVETFRNMPERARQHASKEGEALATLIVNARLNHLHKQMLAHRTELSHLLKTLGHRRTMPMRLAHGIFLALGEVEGAMIGAEQRFETSCQPLIDLIAVRTNELGRYC
ncbi:hypothetical protein H4CHR_05551 [Variovorax sp. PBS-H4]|nr:hypothetical protein H4CHR_05551 [Variovorax sp. PBS-H4]